MRKAAATMMWQRTHLRHFRTLHHQTRKTLPALQSQEGRQNRQNRQSLQSRLERKAMESDTKPEAVGVAVDVFEGRLGERQDPVDAVAARGAIDRGAGLEAAEREDRTEGVEAEAAEVITERDKRRDLREKKEAHGHLYQ